VKRFVTTLTAAALAVMPLTAAGASTAEPHGPLFTCPGRTVCVFSNRNYVGDVETFYTPTSHSRWIPLSFYAQSVNDNSKSAVEFWSDVTGHTRCVTGKENLPLDYDLDWIYIAYNEPNCNHIPPP
jgi:Peptidase inhibitor family I36